MPDNEQNTPNEEEQAWLDACPRGEARSITQRVGELSVDFTVDRRDRSLGGDADRRSEFMAFFDEAMNLRLGDMLKTEAHAEAVLAREMSIGTDIETAISTARCEATEARH
jgi:hypothetical protein